MGWLFACMSGFVGWLCRIFGVSAEEVTKEQDKNPSPTREK